MINFTQQQLNDGGRMLIIKGYCLLLSHLPASHATVRAVRHTAVSCFLISRCVASCFQPYLRDTSLLFFGYVIPDIRAYSGLAPVRRCSCRAYHNKGQATMVSPALFILRCGLPQGDLAASPQVECGCGKAPRTDHAAHCGECR